MSISRLFSFLKIKKPEKLTEKKKLGNIGEDAALEYLKNQGYLLRERNWRHSHYEIDLIMQDMRCIVFCEVKTRDVDKNNYGTPAESVTYKKRENLMKAGAFYMGGVKETCEKWGFFLSCRFDVIEVYVKNNKVIKINHIKDAFIKKRTHKKGTGYKSCRH